MAITNSQLEELGFSKSIMSNTSVKIQSLNLALEEDGVIYARFWKEKDKLYCWAIDQPDAKEFIFLEHLTLKGLELFIQRTSQRLRRWKRNQDYIKQLLHGNSN